MRPWIYGALLVVMVTSPTIGGWYWQRRRGGEPPPSRWPTRRSLAVGRFLFEGRTRIVGYLLYAVATALPIAGTAWGLTQPTASKTSNQMDSGPGLPAWFAYALGAVGWCASMGFVAREIERGERQRRHQRKAS